MFARREGDASIADFEICLQAQKQLSCVWSCSGPQWPLCHIQTYRNSQLRKCAHALNLGSDSRALFIWEKDVVLSKQGPKTKVEVFCGTQNYTKWRGSFVDSLSSWSVRDCLNISVCLSSPVPQQTMVNIGSIERNVPRNSAVIYIWFTKVWRRAFRAQQLLSVNRASRKRRTSRGFQPWRPQTTHH